jgi:phage gp29-like protein
MPKPRKSKPTAPKTVVPTDPVTILSLRYEPSAIAQGMDVDRVHSILRSAESGDTREMFALYRDIVLGHSHLQGEFAKRKLAVIGDTITFAPFDKTAPDDVIASDSVRAMVSGCQSWLTACLHALDSCLYPVSLIEKVFASTGRADLPFALKSLVPVPHHLLDFSSGAMRIYNVDPATGAILSTSRPVDPARYIVHRGHILSTPDNWGGPMRSLLFWWLLSTMGREWWARFLDRYGSPFLVGHYDRGDKDSRSVLERAFALSVKLGGLVVADGTRVEIQQAAAASTGDAYDKFLTICNREMSKLVLGQTLSAEAQPTGLGSGVSAQQESVRQDIRKFDAVLLAATLREQLVLQYCQINGLTGRPPTLIWGSDSVAEIASTMGLLKSISGTDVELTDEAIATVSERTGLQLRRRQSPVQSPSPFSSRPVPFSADAPSSSAADLLPLLREYPAAVARAIRESKTPDECRDRIAALYSSQDRRRTSALLADALALHAALAVARP